jgi:hypothetical protein
MVSITHLTLQSTYTMDHTRSRSRPQYSHAESLLDFQSPATTKFDRSLAASWLDLGLADFRYVPPPDDGPTTYLQHEDICDELPSNVNTQAGMIKWSYVKANQ